MIDKLLVSVIIPVYNAEKTLMRTLDSLFTQTYRNIEILLINDCSTDNSLEVMNLYKKRICKEDKISLNIINHEINRGVAAARNTGLENATGIYIYYVDADDWIEPETLGFLIDEAHKQEADIVGHELWMKYEKERHLKMPDVNDGIDAFQKMACGLLRWNLWLYLVQKDLYTNNDINFLAGENMGEDMMVMGKLFLCAKKVKIVHKPFYHYVAYNPTSLTKDNSNQRINQVTANIKELESFVSTQKNAELHNFLQYLKLQVKIPLLISNKNYDFQLWLQWFPEVNSYAFTNTMPLRTRILQYLAVNRYFGILKIHYWITNSLIKLLFK